MVAIFQSNFFSETQASKLLREGLGYLESLVKWNHHDLDIAAAITIANIAFLSTCKNSSNHL
jgi:hypothetical protein